MKNFLNFIALIANVYFAIFSNTQAQTIINIQPGPSEGKDCEVWSINPNNNYSDWPYVKANAWTWGGTFGIERTYIQFDLADVPPDADILEAKLSFFYHYLSGNPEQTHQGANQSVLKRVTSEWSENGITWNNQPSTSSANQVSIPASIGPQADYLDIDVTDMVIDMVENPDENFGFLFQLAVEDTYRRIGLSSSDHPDPAKWPLLTIIIDCEMPVADFTMEDFGNYIQFNDNSTGATSWDWDFGDGYSSTLQNPVHSYQESGVFQVCLTVSNSCGSDTKCDTIRPSFTSRTNEFSKYITDLQIFPNPTSEKLIINFQSEESNQLVIKIYDLKGKIVISETKDLIKGSNSFPLNLCKLLKGPYLINLSTQSFTVTERILIE
ncbi:MAG TPA: DNRLRE domain-containing protein [Bacteroidales bacterium]|nr:DNRLRE domain-containing protein [Bacteroidales bacterium]HRX96635.1 DNRLRE domain-containing protein [Bacteroidales bacterium]